MNEVVCVVWWEVVVAGGGGGGGGGAMEAGMYVATFGVLVVTRSPHRPCPLPLSPPAPLLTTPLLTTTCPMQVLDRYFGNVCELDLIFNFHKAYHILDELLICGELQAPI